MMLGAIDHLLYLGTLRPHTQLWKLGAPLSAEAGISELQEATSERGHESV